ncbi:hypothetical protein MVEN_01378500 [Mycena venus]|uniref:Uncharacterized protein n=1 Tax=Mycena venus TaxID=2733690 RepID=A0A8H6XYH5_9AGAR|nr:hypothetical protein MVEN_01378500 [Mycena venus]
MSHVYCNQCDLHFVDVEARSEHIESSLNHPFCETCCRRFLNKNALSSHLKFAAPHLCLEDEEFLDGDEILLSWTSSFALDFNTAEEKSWSEEDYWSSGLDTDSDDSTSDSETELDSEPESEDNRDCTIVLAGAEFEPIPEYPELLFENLVDSSEIPAPCHRQIGADSSVFR